jgi:hypothetical protein
MKRGGDWHLRLGWYSDRDWHLRRGWDSSRYWYLRLGWDSSSRDWRLVLEQGLGLEAGTRAGTGT